MYTLRTKEHEHNTLYNEKKESFSSPSDIYTMFSHYINSYHEIPIAARTKYTLVKGPAVRIRMSRVYTLYTHIYTYYTHTVILHESYKVLHYGES